METDFQMVLNFPHKNWDQNNIVGLMDLGSLNAKTKPGDEYIIELEGYNIPRENWYKISYSPESPITATQLLEYFKDRLNEQGGISWKECNNDGCEDENRFQKFTPIIKGTRLVLELDSRDRKFHLQQTISTLADNGELFNYPRTMSISISLENYLETYTNVTLVVMKHDKIFHMVHSKIVTTAHYQLFRMLSH